MMQQAETKSDLTRRIFLGAGTAAAVVAFLRLHRGPTHVEARDITPKTIQIVDFSDTGKPLGPVSVQTIVKPDSEWQKQLSSSSYNVTRLASTEYAYSGKYAESHEKGLYRCICCATALFSSDTKFDSGTGWPSFYQIIAKENVSEIPDSTYGAERTAVSCARCDAHLGHVFNDGPDPTGLRYCMNSVSLNFIKFA
jgi:peptide-methionine (R)-S-oxide reductase